VQAPHYRSARLNVAELAIGLATQQAQMRPACSDQRGGCVSGADCAFAAAGARSRLQERLTGSAVS
jgi:hypothetical protein